MLIQIVEIENFRSLKDVKVELEELTVLLGRNGAGKSSVLNALDVFYNVAAQITDFDYFAKDTNADIKIRVHFGGLNDEERNEFRSQMTGDRLIVTKVVNSGGAKYYGAARELPEFHEARQLSARDKRTRVRELIDSGRFGERRGQIRSADDAEGAMASIEADFPELLRVFESEQQFFGPKNIGGGKLDNFTKFVLIPAVRDAAGEAEKKGAILQLIDVLVMRSVNRRPDVRKLNEDFAQRIKEVYSHENLGELAELAGMITALLAHYAPGAELELAFGEIIPPKIPLPPAIASLVEDNFRCPISYTGHGLQRALIFALLQQLTLTDLAPEIREGAEDEGGSEGVPVARVPDLILAIEEPELYLHPARSRYLARVFDELSSTPETQEEPRTQVVMATHSPYFISMERFDRIRVARKVPVEGEEVLQCRLSGFTRADAAGVLSDISGNAANVYTAESFAARAEPVMTSMVNEGFFADAVVVVEGVADAAILMAVQEIMGKRWDACGIAVVPADGKNNIDRPVVVFRGLGIPSYFLFDGDSRYRGRDANKERSAIRANGVLLRLAGVAQYEFPDTQVHGTWAVFSDEMETELRAVSEEEFSATRDEVAMELGYDKPSMLFKNSCGAARFVQRFYERGNTIPVIERIVERVTSLRAPD